MIITLKPNSNQDEKEQLMSWISGQGLDVDVSNDGNRELIRLIGDTDAVNTEMISLLEMVEGIRKVNEPYKKANRKFHPEDTSIDVNGVKIGGGNFAVIAGPCSVESEEQIVELAQELKSAGANILRGGAFKPTTASYGFQGMNKNGIEYLKKAREITGLPIVIEIMNISHLPLFDDVDIIQIGARNMQNYELLKAVARSNKPVLLKRGVSNTLEELLMSAECLMAYGNENVILCERGIRSFERYTSNTLDISAVPALHKLSHLPVVVDPSHASGKSYFVDSMAAASTAAGADGLVIEVHNDPAHALEDGPQSLNPVQFKNTMEKISAIRRAITE